MVGGGDGSPLVHIPPSQSDAGIVGPRYSDVPAKSRGSFAELFFKTSALASPLLSPLPRLADEGKDSLGFKLVASGGRRGTGLLAKGRFGRLVTNSSGTSVSGVHITCTPFPHNFPGYYPGIAIASCMWTFEQRHSSWPKSARPRTEGLEPAYYLDVRDHPAACSLSRAREDSFRSHSCVLGDPTPIWRVVMRNSVPGNLAPLSRSSTPARLRGLGLLAAACNEMWRNRENRVRRFDGISYDCCAPPGYLIYNVGVVQQKSDERRRNSLEIWLSGMRCAAAALLSLRCCLGGWSAVPASASVPHHIEVCAPRPRCK